MGMTYKFACTSCDLAAEVSGGPDRGFFVRTGTMYCRACKALRDVPVEYFHDPGHPVWEESAADRDRLGKCPACAGTDLFSWSAGDPCPKCGGLVSQGAPDSLWD